MIRAENLMKSYADTTVVDIAELKLPQGGVTALIGPNGAGKSTLLSMIGRLETPTKGSVFLDGQDIRSIRNTDLARRLAVLKQDNTLSARLTVRDLVTFGRYPYSKGRTTPQDRQKVAASLELVALTPFTDRFLDELSGGQRQRAFVAMVLAQDTEYALFDEPLNSLDISHAVTVIRLLRQAASDLGKTVVVVLHDLNFAARHADHIIAMQAGRIVESGPAKQIIREDLLRSLYDTELSVTTRNGRVFVDVFG
ncbi:ATP-binding cassette domain-containing protein [Roseobacter sp. N2S]|uniref:iron ABC transporter ATP-binding protein n=1 Tax=Roseobacter sp. N2S TaxID=2663844 RepID=UPI00285455DA|nr:ATP-binding cassette domain-containing protein [Roseobacter sp. N2S]MDR6265770.1 iron complex transport system ATP-binding protein [Roseobacter sp. N2S]